MPVCNIIYLKCRQTGLLTCDQCSCHGPTPRRTKRLCCSVSPDHALSRNNCCQLILCNNPPTNERLTAGKQPTSRLAAYGAPLLQLCRSPSASCHGNEKNINLRTVAGDANTDHTNIHSSSICSSCRATRCDLRNTSMKASRLTCGMHMS